MCTVSADASSYAIKVSSRYVSTNCECTKCRSLLSLTSVTEAQDKCLLSVWKR
jgi:hypothetical protein